MVDYLVEANETYVGAAKPGVRGRGTAGKTIVAGVVERGGANTASVVWNVKTNTFIPMIEQTTDKSAVIYTDDMPSYNKLMRVGYEHKVSKHMPKVYLVVAKARIDGVYHSVSPKYLQQYVNECSFRYSHRKDANPMYKVFYARLRRRCSLDRL